MGKHYANGAKLLASVVCVIFNFTATSQKWLSEQDSLQIDAVVYITNEITPPGKWPLGRVTALHPGKDGNVRVVKLNTATTTLTRPIVKLILLFIS